MRSRLAVPPAISVSHVKIASAAGYERITIWPQGLALQSLTAESPLGRESLPSDVLPGQFSAKPRKREVKQSDRAHRGVRLRDSGGSGGGAGRSGPEGDRRALPQPDRLAAAEAGQGRPG